MRPSRHQQYEQQQQDPQKSYRPVLIFRPTFRGSQPASDVNPIHPKSRLRARLARIFRGWVHPGVDPGFLVRGDDGGAKLASISQSYGQKASLIFFDSRCITWTVQREYLQAYTIIGWEYALAVFMYFDFRLGMCRVFVRNSTWRSPVSWFCVI